MADDTMVGFDAKSLKNGEQPLASQLFQKADDI